MYLITYWWWQLTLGKIQMSLIFIKGLNHHASDAWFWSNIWSYTEQPPASAELEGWLGVAGAGAGVVMFQDLDIASCQICTNQRSLLIKYKNVTFSYLNSYGTSYNIWWSYQSKLVMFFFIKYHSVIIYQTYVLFNLSSVWFEGICTHTGRARTDQRCNC